MRLIFIFISIILSSTLIAQFPSFKLGGLSRALSNTAYLGDEDTSNNDISQDFNIVFDLAINGKLNKHINLYSELRLGSNLEVFDTSSSYLKVRRLLIFGDLSNDFSFELGDIDLKMTPFTLWNSIEEGNVNESNFFNSFREIQQYENFNFGNLWRRQGATIFGKKSLIGKDSLTYKMFGTRELASNEVSVPDMFLYGGNISLVSKNYSFGVNYVNLFTNNKSISIDTNVHNHVVSSSSIIKLNKIELNAEAGISKLSNNFLNQSSKWVDGEFFKVEINTQLTKKILYTLSFRSVSDDFSSPGAQTKRINYSLIPNLFPIVGNSSDTRNINANEIITDINFFRSQSIYNRTISYGLDMFNPIFGVAEPYGISTPNRRGLTTGFDYKDTSGIFKFKGILSYLTDLTGEGVSEKRNYLSFSVFSDILINKALKFNNTILLKCGFYSSSSKREHSPQLFVENVNYKNSILDIGLDLEFLENFYLMFGYKNIHSKGIDYLPIRNNNFSISSYNKFESDMNQKINSVGLKYNFNDNSSLLLNYHSMNYNNKLSDLNFKINQIFILAQIKF